MASKESGAVRDLYLSWTAARLEGEQHDDEAWVYSHRKLFGHLAKAAGVRALVFDYRLTPEHTHPAQVDDAITAYRWLLDQGIDAGQIAFTGDSSGGGLAITTQLRARELGLPLPAAAMAAGRAPEADDGIRKLAEWVRPKLGLTSAARAA
jgi:acetyl esterase/lipase